MNANLFILLFLGLFAMQILAQICPKECNTCDGNKCKTCNPNFGFEADNKNPKVGICQPCNSISQTSPGGISSCICKAGYELKYYQCIPCR